MRLIELHIQDHVRCFQLITLLHQCYGHLNCAYATLAGAADGSLKVWDRRKLPATGSAPDGTLATFSYHSEAIMRVEWHPTERVRPWLAQLLSLAGFKYSRAMTERCLPGRCSLHWYMESISYACPESPACSAVCCCCDNCWLQGVFASGGEDHLVVVWSLERAGAAAAAAAAAAGSSKAGKDPTPPEVLFKHVGHRAGVSEGHWLGPKMRSGRQHGGVPGLINSMLMNAGVAAVPCCLLQHLLRICCRCTA
jgi:WD40 repeat protein